LVLAGDIQDGILSAIGTVIPSADDRMKHLPISAVSHDRTMRELDPGVHVSMA
jgi:hypothetical protein